jgi:K+/H+ antiporter YhaU regulatory subunit KhtT
MREYIAFARNPEMANIINGVELKAERKRQVEEQLKDLIIGNPYLAEANRAIFRSILNFYSRDSYFAYKELMR